MKRILIICLLTPLLVSQRLYSQTPENTQSQEEFRGRLQELMDESGDASAAGDYCHAALCMRRAFDMYNAAPEQLRLDGGYIPGLICYNSACYNSLAGNPAEALAALEKAVVDYAWDDYAHTLTDSDLDNIRDVPRFAELMALLREKGDFLWVLGDCGDYAPQTGEQLPSFTYQRRDDPDLTRVREYFSLDSIAGGGDETSRILNLLRWVHNAVRHDGGSLNPRSKNAIDLVEICRREGRGVNCRMMAQILNECYLAIGFKSRYVTCMPRVYVYDCHVINTVYSETLGKWIWVDPTFNAWVADENGSMLGIGEVRDRLRRGAPLKLNEDANWNNEQPQTKEHYLDYYMAKNLYWLVSPLHSVSDAETAGKGERPRFVALVPPGYSPGEEHGSAKPEIETSDDRYFWQRPE